MTLSLFYVNDVQLAEGSNSSLPVLDSFSKDPLSLQSEQDILSLFSTKTFCQHECKGKSGLEEEKSIHDYGRDFVSTYRDQQGDRNITLEKSRI